MTTSDNAIMLNTNFPKIFARIYWYYMSILLSSKLLLLTC